MRIHFISNNTFFLQDVISELSNTNITYKSDEITTNTDWVVVDEEIQENHPDILKAKELNLRTLSLAEFIYEYFKSKTRVVVTGRFGTSDIFKMVVHTMDFHNIPISYYTNNQVKNKFFRHNEEAEFAIIEGNEKKLNSSKFHMYHPTVALVSGVSGSDDSEKYLSFIDEITKGGILIYNKEDILLQEIVNTSENPIRKIEYETPEFEVNGKTIVLITNEGELPIENIDKQNIINIEGAKWLCQNMGIDPTDFYEAMASF